MDFEGAGNSLVSVVLGALILWVGQTTFQHAGVLAGIDHQFEGVVAQNEHLRNRLDAVLDDLDKRTQQRFTSADGEELETSIKEIASQVDLLERRLVDRVTALQMKVLALESQNVDRWELARMQNDLEQVRQRLGRPAGVPRVAHTSPAYLPSPVEAR